MKGRGMGKAGELDFFVHEGGGMREGSFVGHTARKPPLDGAFFYCLLGWEHQTPTEATVILIPNPFSS
jgi:hypothetical protein